MAHKLVLLRNSGRKLHVGKKHGEKCKVGRGMVEGRHSWWKRALVMERCMVEIRYTIRDMVAIGYMVERGYLRRQ